MTSRAHILLPPGSTQQRCAHAAANRILHTGRAARPGKSCGLRRKLGAIALDAQVRPFESLSNMPGSPGYNYHRGHPRPGQSLRGQGWRQQPPAENSQPCALRCAWPYPRPYRSGNRNSHVHEGKAGLPFCSRTSGMQPWTLGWSGDFIAAVTVCGRFCHPGPY